MDINKIKEMAELMKDMELSKLEIEEDDVKILIERESHQIVQSAPAQVAAASAERAVVLADTSGIECERDDLTTIKSPMVGVFYAAPAPGERAYVTVGDKVKKGDVLCIIEAMKLMNEINAEYSGVVAEVCTGNGQVVEFNQPLFRLRCEDE